MRTCPVCETECKTIICARCGFDGSRDYERWPTIATLDVSVDSVAERRKALRTLAACGNCGGTGFVIDAATGQVICGNCRTPWKPVTPAPEPAEEKVPAEEAVVDEISPFEPDEEPEKKPKRRLRTRGKLVLGAAAACLLIVLAVLLYHPWNGWFERSGKTYYYVDGRKLKGLSQIGEHTYYFDDCYINDGQMRTGLAYINKNDDCCYFNNEGVLQTGWQQPYGYDWYYFDENGVQQLGWIIIDGKTYYVEYSKGRLTGLQTISGNTYYYDEDGVMQTGWTAIDDKTYYFNYNGTMVTGWAFLACPRAKTLVHYGWFYFDNDGVLQTEWVTIDGKAYWLDYYGGKVIGLQTIDGDTYYFDSEGVMQTDYHVTINGLDYYFDKKGVGRVVGD